MAYQEKLLEVLIQLVTDKYPCTWRYGSETIFTFACVESNTVRIASQPEREILGTLIYLLINNQVEKLE